VPLAVVVPGLARFRAHAGSRRRTEGGSAFSKAGLSEHHASAGASMSLGKAARARARSWSASAASDLTSMRMASRSSVSATARPAGVARSCVAMKLSMVLACSRGARWRASRQWASEALSWAGQSAGSGM